jgi:hypothetical protein
MSRHGFTIEGYFGLADHGDGRSIIGKREMTILESHCPPTDVSNQNSFGEKTHLTKRGAGSLAP